METYMVHLFIATCTQTIYNYYCGCCTYIDLMVVSKAWFLPAVLAKLMHCLEIAGGDGDTQHCQTKQVWVEKMYGIIWPRTYFFKTSKTHQKPQAYSK